MQFIDNDGILKKFFRVYYRCNNYRSAYLEVWFDVDIYKYDYITKKCSKVNHYCKATLDWIREVEIIDQERIIPKDELENYIKELEEKRRLEEMNEFTITCYQFLDEYQDKKITKIIKKYDELLKEIIEGTDKYKAEELLAEIANRNINEGLEQFKPLLPSNFDRDDLRIECTPRVVDISGEEVKFELSNNDKEALNELSADKECEINELRELVEEVKMMVSTCEKDKEFKEILATYNIISNVTGRLII